MDPALPHFLGQGRQIFALPPLGGYEDYDGVLKMSAVAKMGSGNGGSQYILHAN